MADVVAVLRAVTEDDAYASPWTFGETCREAAAEIETLRAERSALVAVNDRLVRSAESLRARLSQAGAGGGVVRPTGHVKIEHDGFTGDIIGYYTTREGKHGVVVQQERTRVVHVYGEKWIPASSRCAICGGEHDNDLGSDICQRCEQTAPWREATPPATPVPTASVEAVAATIDRLAQCHSENAMDRAFLDNSEEIAAAILLQLNSVSLSASPLTPSLAEQLEAERVTVRNLHEELQRKDALLASLTPAPTRGLVDAPSIPTCGPIAPMDDWPKDPETGLNDLSLGVLLRKTREEATPSSPVSAPSPSGEDPRWQKLRDMLGLDGWHDGRFNGLPNPDQIVTHVQHVANERARLLLAPSPAGGGLMSDSRLDMAWADGAKAAMNAMSDFLPDAPAVREMDRIISQRQTDAIAGRKSAKPNPSPAGGVREAATELLSHLKLYDFIERDPSGELHDRMYDLTRALSSEVVEAGYERPLYCPNCRALQPSRAALNPAPGHGEGSL